MVKPVLMFPTQQKPIHWNNLKFCPAEMQMNWRYNQHENQQWDGDNDDDVDNGDFSEKN